MIEKKWLEVLQRLDKRMVERKFQPFLETDPKLVAMQRKQFEGEQGEYLELTAIASLKNIEDIHDTFDVSYEEDEDCDYKSIENDLLRSGSRKYWTFEVDPLNRSHPQIPLQIGFITAKNYEAAKAKLMALPDLPEEK